MMTHLLFAVSLLLAAGPNPGPPHAVAIETRDVKAEAALKEPWIPLWMSVRERLSDDDWRHVASRYSIVVAAFGDSPKNNERARWIKSLNPNMRLLVFLSALSLANTGLNPKGDSFAQEHPDWFLKDKNGEWIRTSIFGNILFDPGNKEVQKFLAQKAKEFVESYGYDGLWLDLVETTTKFPNHNLQKSRIVNQKTGEPYTDEEWKSVMLELVGVVRQFLGKKLFIVNGSQGSGKVYFQNAYADFFKHTDGLTYETFSGGFAKSVTAFRNEDEWKSDIDAMVDSVKRGQVVLCVGDVKKPADGEAMAEYNRLYRFIITSFLLGKGKNCYLWIYADVPKSIATWTWRRDVEEILPNYWDMPSLGAPRGAYIKVSGVYQREFEKGRVLVNPTGREIEVPLQGRWCTEKGDPVQSPLVLAPHTGEILLQQWK